MSEKKTCKDCPYFELSEISKEIEGAKNLGTCFGAVGAIHARYATSPQCMMAEAMQSFENLSDNPILGMLFPGGKNPFGA